MSNNKTDKIRERLRDCNDYRDWQDLMDGYDRVSSALESVVEECNRDHPSEHINKAPEQFADDLLALIADELDVE